jgi:hypothetical protein
MLDGQRLRAGDRCEKDEKAGSRRGVTEHETLQKSTERRLAGTKDVRMLRPFQMTVADSRGAAQGAPP